MSLHLPAFAESNGSQSVLSGPAASASPGKGKS